ncbi:MAG: site-specific DNA-methyltransferase, partial [Nitrospirae bacterium]|nr:site-specific DNA-methyltransferase [Nitrospirota bacterium]
MEAQMSNAPEKMDGTSLDIAAENRARLKAMFPTVFTETVNDKGELVESVDFEKLKAELGTFTEFFESRRERYGMDWPCKKETMRLIQTTSAATLKPCREESVNFDTTENLFIEGDNLEVLKLLQKSYYGKVKMIYIDPPYNTGNEFIYPDNYSESLETYLEYAGLIDGEGRKFSTNTANEGRFHTKWLNMMYPRLYLARNLLRDDGVIFISIDDNEVSNLKKICDEIFGEENFVGLFVINSSPSAIDYGHIAQMHDYCLFYAKSLSETITSHLPEENKNFKYEDNIGQFNLYPLYNGNVAFNPKTRPNLFYPFYLNPSHKIAEDFYEIGLEEHEGWVKIYPVISKKDSIQHVWRWSKNLSYKHLNQEIVGYKTEDGEYRIVQKTRHTGKVIRSLQIDKNISTRRGTAEVENIFNSKIFQFPKPIELIKRFMSIGMQEDDIILDFFSGSCTTAHAVLDLNKQDNGNRKFIMVQLPEPCA